MKWLGGIIWMVWLVGASVWAQQGASHGISISYVYPKLTVSVSEPSDLAVVLARLCKETESDCDGLDQAASPKVAAGTLSGSWNEVVDQLMEGSKLNYATSSPSPNTRGRLIVQGTKLALLVPSGQNMTVDASSKAPATLAMSGSTPSAENRNESTPNDSSSPQEMGSSGSMGTSQSNGTTDMGMGNYQGTLQSVLGTPLTSDTSQRVPSLPFPDSRGNPIPTSGEPIHYLPFPDSQGRLIPVDPNAPTGSPFPVEAIQEANRKLAK